MLDLYSAPEDSKFQSAVISLPLVNYQNQISSTRPVVAEPGANISHLDCNIH